MVAVVNPCNSDLPREAVFFHLAGAAEAVSCALYDQRWRTQRFQMFEPGARRFAGRMERIAEADEAADLSVVRHHTGNPAAQRFPADYELPASAEPLNHLPPGIKQHGLAVWRALCAVLAPRAHITELKAHDSQLVA